MEPLLKIPLKEWHKLEQVFKEDGPRGIPGYYMLKTQRKWHKIGLDYGLEVLCPGGDVNNGFVAINEKSTSYEVIFQCPKQDTSILAEAVKKTNIIDWKRSLIVVPFTSDHVIYCLKNIMPELNVKIDRILPSYSFVYYSNRGPFENVQLPENITFESLTLDHVDLVDSVWPHRYSSSKWYFTQLIQAGSSFGLYREKTLVSWAFIYEVGTLGHIFTLENYRRKGYAELLLKLLTNQRIAEGEDVFAFTVKSNVKSYEMFRKLGFEEFDGVSWLFLKPMDVNAVES